MRPARTSALRQKSRHTANGSQALSASQKRTLFGILVGYLSFSRSGDRNMPAHACLAPRKPFLVLAVGEDSLVVGQRNSGRYTRHITELRTVVQQDDILGPSRHTLNQGFEFFVGFWKLELFCLKENVSQSAISSTAARRLLLGTVSAP